MEMETKEPIQVTISAVDALKLDLAEGDTLAVTIKSDDVTASLLGHLKKNLEDMFPGNRILIFGMGLHDEMKFNVISKINENKENKENKGCETNNYCVDCNCGKKEQLTGDNNG